MGHVASIFCRTSGKGKSMMHLEVEMFTNDRIFIEIMHFAFAFLNGHV